MCFIMFVIHFICFVFRISNERVHRGDRGQDDHLVTITRLQLVCHRGYWIISLDVNISGPEDIIRKTPTPDQLMCTFTKSVRVMLDSAYNIVKIVKTCHILDLYYTLLYVCSPKWHCLEIRTAAISTVRGILVINY